MERIQRPDSAAGTNRTGGRVQHYLRPTERRFTADQRSHTTLLFGGLTWKHDDLIRAGLEGLGYGCEPLPVPDVRSFQLGKEFGNNGQCNPTYFTVGNLVKHLQGLAASGKSREEICDQYVFFTAGACGPCRFGMYESEYRLALRNAGFERFRVLLFQQSRGLSQGDVEDGLAMNLDFFLSILNALNMGDLLNEVVYQIRPYEVNPGETDRVVAGILDDLSGTMTNKKRFRLEGRAGALLGSIPGLERRLGAIGRWIDQLNGSEYTEALGRARRALEAIEVDRLRVKPVVKITGEFWAQTTEGDGNFRMFSFLERENAQVLVEPVATWICYMIHGAQNKIRDRAGLEEGMVRPTWGRPLARLRVDARARSKIRRLGLARAIFVREYERYRKALGGMAHPLADQLELERIAHPMYNTRAGGGEGHLEVAKNVYYHNRDLCHMVLSLKPFGCMPSTQSDGVQSAVMSRFPDMIYLPIETSGEGEINAHSRVQMALGEARAKARAEFERASAEAGYPLEQVREYIGRHPELRRATYIPGHHKGYVGVAANFLLDVAGRMKEERITPAAGAHTGQAQREAASPAVPERAAPGTAATAGERVPEEARA
jgi:predicted nucleotide-binding protein (sugar kinase/HSP70/actin superfamily)